MNKRFKNNLNSSAFRITATIGILLILLLVGVAFAQTLRNRNQTVLSSKQDPLIEQIQKSANYSIRIEQDADAPLKILESSVKEVSATDYEKLTSEKPASQTIISAPTTKMVNVSDKVITQVMINIYDAATDRGKGLFIRELSIKPGDTYTIAPENFVRQETVTKVDENNNLASTVNAAMRNKKFWLPFTDKSQIQVRISVTFDDGTKWFNRSQNGETEK
jgi:low affinity Fe/Cu permease